MLKKGLMLIALLIGILNANDIWNNYLSKSYNTILERSVLEQKILNERNKANKIYQKNIITKSLMEKNLPEVMYKKPKEIYIYVRKNYKIINGDMIVLEPASWKVVLIKPKQEWQY